MSALNLYREVKVVCFFCDGDVEEGAERLTGNGRVIGPCCDDLADSEGVVM